MNNKITQIGLFFLMLFASCAYFNTFYNAQTYYEMGIRDYQISKQKNQANYPRDNFNIAIDKAEKVLLKYPDSKWCDDAQFIIAASNYYKGNYRKAKKEIENFFEKYPNSELKNEMDIWYGKVFWKMGSPVSAVRHWQQMVDEVGDNELKATIYYTIAEVYEDIDAPDSAIAYYKKTTAVRGGSDKHGLAQYNIARLYLDLGKMDKASENIEKVGRFAISSDLRQKRQLLLLKIYRQAGRYDKAEKIIFDKLNSEKNKEIWGQLELELALVYRAQADTAAAISRLKSITNNEAYKRSEAAADAYYHLGMMYLVDSHDYEKAAKYFKQVKSENKESKNVFDAQQRVQQLKSYESITEILKKNRPIVEKIVENLNSPEDEVELSEIDTTDKTAEEIKEELEKQQQSLADVDTLQTFETYYENLYELAELYYFDFNFKDSAKYILKNLTESQYFNPFIEKSLYAMYYISELETNREGAEYYKNVLKKLNPESPYYTFIEEGKAIYPDQFKAEKEKFQAAEKLIPTNPDSAIVLFEQLINMEKKHPYKGKSATNIAWIMENKKYDLEKTIKWYKTAADSFPNSETASWAQERAATFQKVLDELNAPKDTTVVDSTITDNTEPDSTKESTNEKKFTEDELKKFDKELQELKNKGNNQKNETDLPDKNTGK